MQSKHYLFKYSLKEAIINLIKIKSSDQMFTGCVCIGDCLLSRRSGLKTIRPSGGVFFQKWGRFGKKYGRNDFHHHYQKLLIKKWLK